MRLLGWPLLWLLALVWNMSPFKSSPSVWQRHNRLLCSLHVLLGRFVFGNVETLLGRNYSSLGFNWFRSPGRTSTSAISCPSGSRQIKASQRRDANAGAASTVLANQISSCTAISLANFTARIDGAGHRFWGHPVQNVVVGIALSTQWSKNHCQRHAHHYSYRRIYQSNLHSLL